MHTNSTSSSSVTEQTTTRSLWCSHDYPVREQKGNLLQLPGDYSILYHRKNPPKNSTEQIGIQDHWRIPASESVSFQSKKITTDMVFILWQIQENRQEQNRELYVTFVDLIWLFSKVPEHDHQVTWDQHVTFQNPSWSPIEWSRVTSWYWLYLANSSTWGSNKPQKILNDKIPSWWQSV